MSKKPLLSDGWEDFYEEPFPGKDSSEVVEVRCGRCGGSGYIHAFAYIESGRCFDCDGGGGVHMVSVHNARAKAEARAKNKARKFNKEKKIKEDALASISGTDLEKAFKWGMDKDIPFFFSVYNALIRFGALSQRQSDGVLRVWKEGVAKEEEPEAKSPAPEGRIEVTGTVLSIKEYENFYGYGDSVILKMLVLHEDGWTTFGTVPSSILPEVKKSDKVQFMATLTPKEDNEEFAYYSRPTKAKIIS